MAYLQYINGAKNPDGTDVVVYVTGTVANTNTPLQASGTWSSGWLTRGQYIGVQIVLYSDIDGSYIIEYSDDPSDNKSLSMPTSTINYSKNQLTRKAAFDIPSEYVRVTYSNGSVAQASFKLDIRFLTSTAQCSVETLNAVGADSRFAQWTKTRIETKEADFGVYAPIYRTGNSLNVIATNFPSSINATNPLPVTIISGGNSGGTVTFPTNQNVTVTNFPATQPISGSVTANLPSNSVIGISGTVLIKADSGQTNSLKVDGSGVTQPISGTVAISNLPATQAVSGSVSISNLPASQHVTIDNPSVVVTGTVGLASGSTILVSNFPSTQAVSVSSLPLPTGATTESTLSTRLADATFTSRINTLGQKVSSASTPVVLASDQSPLTVIDTYQNPIGSQGNLFNNITSTVAGGASNTVDLGGRLNVSLFGNSSVINLQIQIQFSIDGTNFYTGYTYTLGVGNFYYNFTTAARYVRLFALSAVSTITATLTAK